MKSRVRSVGITAGVDSRRVLAGVQLRGSLGAEIMGLPGMRHFPYAMAEDGPGWIVSPFEPGEVTPENAERVRAIRANFSDLLEGMPAPETFEVIADWGK